MKSTHFAGELGLSVSFPLEIEKYSKHQVLVFNFIFLKLLKLKIKTHSVVSSSNFVYTVEVEFFLQFNILLAFYVIKASLQCITFLHG